jgi:hypothetical protein
MSSGLGPADRRGVHAVRPRDVGAGLAGVEATEGFLIVRPALEAIEFAAKVVTLPPKLIALAKRHNRRGFSFFRHARRSAPSFAVRRSTGLTGQRPECNACRGARMRGRGLGRPYLRSAAG